MISKQEVTHIAKLARLQLSDSEIEKMQKDLTAILDYFDILKKIRKSKLKTQNHSSKLKTYDNVLRKDEAMARDPNLANDLLRSAPETKDGYIKVKSIL
jgi:aspartyl-tRNA(Asn)/glutamyl-tRNA(Gln) amidotransferase subunit C